MITIIRCKNFWLPLLICSFFFVLYTTLGIIKHNHFLSGYDLDVIDQVTWEYSQFLPPISTPHAYPFTLVFTDHIEWIYLLLSPIFWIWNDIRALIIVQSLFICFSGIPVYLLAQKYLLQQKIKKSFLHANLLPATILISYLMFYGIQNAIWNDVHSNVFGTSFFMWFIYFADASNLKLSTLFFILAITAKEDMSFIGFFIAAVFWFIQKKKRYLIYMIIAVSYLFAVFFVYYPHFTLGYRFQDKNGLLGNLKPTAYVDTASKRDSIWFSLLSFGFLPLLSPLYLIPAFADITHFFVFGSAVHAAQEIFLHYRVTLAPLLIWPTIMTCKKLLSGFKLFKRRVIDINYLPLSLYLLFFVLLTCYVLHEPLTYLSKRWFWTPPASVTAINQLLKKIPPSAAVVAQNNIAPHLTHRKNIFTLWPDHKSFTKNSPCGRIDCAWFHWVGHPQYLIVSTDPAFDIRHFLADRPKYIEGLQNIEKEGIVQKENQIGYAVLYRVLKNPN